MQGELPQFTRCCCCIPLRRGLIGYSYLRLMLAMINASYVIWITCFLFFLLGGLQGIWFLLLILAFILTDCVFSVLLIVAGHMKSAKLMRVSYICSIVWMCMEMVFTFFIICVSVMHLTRYWNHSIFPRKQLVVDMVMGFTLPFLTLFVQGYVILLIRSEMIKLQNQCLEMQFTNHAADGEAQCVRADKHHDENEITVKA